MDHYGQNLGKIRNAILRSKSIAISGHVNPDGDSIGGLLALGLALDGMGKKVYMLCQDEIPSNYRSLPGAERVVKTTNKKVDLAIAVDCSVIGLLGSNIPVFKKAKSILEIDHHEFRRPFGSIRFIDYKAAAVGELIYILLKELGAHITPHIGENILTSIIVETNLFRLGNVRQLTFGVCAELLGKKIDFPALVHRVYGPKTKQAIMLTAKSLLRARFLKGGRLIWSVIKKKDIITVGGKDYDADAIASEMCSIKGVMIAVLFREQNKKMLRVSLRSKGGINVGGVAQKFGGGGHFDIAGCSIPDNPKSIRSIIHAAEELF